MENTISAKFINNRKIVVEIRYRTNPLIADKKGEILSKFLEKKLILSSHWNLGNADFNLRDNKDEDESRTTIFCDANRLAIICSDISSNDKFYNTVENTFKYFKEVIPNVEIERIGCRILGTYKTNSNQYKEVLKGFKSLFPNQILLDEFVVEDLRLQLVYQNGQYHIGPINKNDGFFGKNFAFSEAINEIGFAIDTDNFYIKRVLSEKVNESKIKDVFIASLSVEKSLFEKLSTL
jgi:uncharacterized pyridoxamine 5'-phosphate oxidase family protein